MRSGDIHVNRDVLWASAEAAEELLHHKKQNLDMALYTDLALQDSVKEQLFRWAKAYHPNCHLERYVFIPLSSSYSIDRHIVNNPDFVFLRCKLHTLEKKCCTGVEKLRALIGEHLQNGIPVSEILEKTKSFLTLRKALLSHNGYSKYSRDILRLFPDAEEDLAPLCF